MTLDNFFPQKNALFCCNFCLIKTNNKKDFNQHLLTRKHKNNASKYIFPQTSPATYDCDCGKIYKYKQGLSKHKIKCDKKDELILEIIKQNNEFKELIIDQNTQIKNMSQNMIINNINCNTINNKFNINIFLNEQCKDAINIADFINTLKLKLTDLENIGNAGYIDGISKIFIRGLKEMDIHKRPIHCSDLKRETFYIKDKNAWEKENNNKSRIKTAIKQIEYKNIKQIPEWQDNNPECLDSETKKHQEYQFIINKSMGGITDDENEYNYNKIIKNVSKEVFIDKPN